MDIKIRLNSFILFFSVLIIILIDSCNNNNMETQDIVFEKHKIHEDCEMYTNTKNLEIGYLFRIGIAGHCGKISANEYITEYEKFCILKKSLFPRNVRIKGKIVVADINSINKNDTILISVISITKRVSGGLVLVNKKWDDGFELEIK